MQVGLTLGHVWPQKWKALWTVMSCPPLDLRLPPGLCLAQGPGRRPVAATTFYESNLKLGGLDLCPPKLSLGWAEQALDRE